MAPVSDVWLASEKVRKGPKSPISGSKRIAGFRLHICIWLSMIQSSCAMSYNYNRYSILRPTKRTVMQMQKKTFAVAMCLIFCASCFSAAVSCADYESDAATVDFETGDAWGAGAHIDNKKAIEIVNGLIKNHGFEFTEDGYLAELNTILSLAGIKSNLTRLNVSAEAWCMQEIAEKSPNGYGIRGDLAASAEIAISGSITTPNIIDDDEYEDFFDLPPGTELRFEDLVIGAYAYADSYTYMDNSFAVTGGNFDLSVVVSIAGKTNFEITDDDELRVVNGMKEQNLFLNLGIASDFSVSDNPIHLLPPKDGMKYWKDECLVNATISANVNTNLPLDDGRPVNKEIRTSVTDEIEWKVSAEERNGILYITPELDLDDIEDSIDGIVDVPVEDIVEAMTYTYPFEKNTNIPNEILINGSLKLDADGKKTVREGIDKVKSRIDGSMDGITCTVKFLDTDGAVLETASVKYGDTVKLPTRYDGETVTTPEGSKTFIGWIDEYGNVWKADYEVKGDLVLKPVFAKNIDDRKPVDSDFGDSDVINWDLSDDDDFLEDAISNALISGNRTLFVSVSDENGKILYQWKLTAGSDGTVSTGTIVPKITALDTPDKKYLADAADGSKTMYLDFSAQGKMPAGTTVMYYVGDVYSDGTEITVYYDNVSAGTADYAGKSIVRNGYAEIAIPHCSSYMLVGTPSGDGSDSPILIIIAAVIVIAIVAAAVMILRRNRAGSV